MPPPAPLEALASFPDCVGRYPLLAPIGVGGMATVYLARARGAGGFERDVAVKLLHPHLRSEAELCEQLVEEAKLVAQIRHPNVVQVLDVGDDPQGLFLVMEYVEGETLAGLIKAAAAAREPIPPAIALRILSDALRGLHEAHELRDDSGELLGVVHRDFSPQNILVGIDGTARLTDFGVAKVARATAQTRTGLVKGKLGYLSPEQARARPVDRRCDVWAAGVVGWELFAGRRLFTAKDDFSVMLQIVNEPPPRLRSARPDTPIAVDEAIASALTRELDARCATAEQLRLRLVDAWGSHIARAGRRGGDPSADAAEVAAYVRRVAGGTLARRREQIQDLQRARAGGGASPVAGRGGEVPVAGAMEAAPASGASVQADVVDDHTTQLATSRLAASETRARRWSTSGAAGIAVAAVAAALVWGLRASPPSPSSSTLETAAAQGAMPAVAPASDDPIVAGAPASAISPAAGVPAPTVLQVAANEPIARLRIDGRVVALDVAADRVAVPAPDTDASTLVVEAFTADGRRASGIAVGGARVVELEFRRPPRPRAASSPTVTPAGAPTGERPLPLSPSPYGNAP